MQFKRCFKCLLELPLTAFYKHSMMGDGHLNKCKDCTKKDTIQNRVDKIEYYRQYDRARASQPHRVMARMAYAKSDAGMRIARISRKAWEARNPERKAAATAVGNAVRDGRLAKEPCFICGAQAEAHHAAYSLPLHVTWLCEKHHAELHKEHRERQREAA